MEAIDLSKWQRPQSRIVRLEAETSFTEMRPGSSSHHAHVYRIDDKGSRRVFADAYGDTAEEALINAEGIARTLNERFAG